MVFVTRIPLDSLHQYVQCENMRPNLCIPTQMFDLLVGVMDE